MEVVKIGGVQVLVVVTELFNPRLKRSLNPTKWTNSITILVIEEMRYIKCRELKTDKSVVL